MLDIEPIFVEHCTHCHNDANRAGGLYAKLSLESYEQMIVGGTSGRAVIPGDPENSLLTRVLFDPPGGRPREPFDDPTYFDTDEGRGELLLIWEWIAQGARPEAATTLDPDDTGPGNIGDGDPSTRKGAIAARVNAFDPEVGTGAALLTWYPASVEGSDPADLVYEIYESTDSPLSDFSTPAYTTPAGATSFEVDGLEPDQTYYYVVRTNGGAGERDTNTAEVSARLGVYYGPQISEAILTSHCTKCHGGSSPQNDVSFETYLNAVNAVGLTGNREIVPFDASGSTIYQKTGPSPPFGDRMPFDDPSYFSQNPDARERLGRWIDQGSREFPDVTPPALSDGPAANAIGMTAIDVSWNAAEDDVTWPDFPAPIFYRIYVGTQPGGQNFRVPTVTTDVGETEATVTGLAPGTDYYLVVRAVDASGNEDGNTMEAIASTDAPAGDGEPPTFAGAETATVEGPNSVTLSWTAASDDVTGASLIVYDIWLSTTSPVVDFPIPATYSSPPGATSFAVTGLEPDTTYYFIVRARDESGNQDSNTVEVSATTSVLDDTPPLFGGIVYATSSGTSSITLGWTAATDDVSNPAAIIYNVYQAAASGGQTFTSPSYTTGAGATGFEVTGRSPDTTYYFVVRSQDEAGNEDNNTVELWAETDAIPVGSGVDYASQIAPIFASCTACHGGTMGFFFEDYANIESSAIGQPSSFGLNELQRFDSEGSYLIWKVEGRSGIAGSRMPLGGDPLSAGEIRLMADWINQGILEAPDTTMPAFGGATAANPDGIGAIRIEWAPASDRAGTTTAGSPISTPASKIVYNIYESVGTSVSSLATAKYVASGGSTNFRATGLTANTTYYYVVRAVDATGNMDANTVQVSATTVASSDTTPPTFAGAAGAVAVDSSRIIIFWDSATDDVAPPANIVYDIWRSTTTPIVAFPMPAWVSTPAGVTSFSDTTVSADTTYYYVVRARDEFGNQDANTVEVSATTPARDVTPPTFAGIESAVASGTSSITLGWSPADDDVSDPAAIIYNVYQAGASGAQTFATPSYTTGAGATGFEVTGLSPDTTYYFVVRAEDEADNEDSNSVELWASTDAIPLAGGVDYASQIAPIFANCTACHGGTMGFFFEDYANIESSAIGQPSSFGLNELERFDSEESYLIWKIEGRPEIDGSQMPLGGALTGEEIEFMTDWINEGILEVPDRTPPTFDGAAAADPDGPGAIRVEWAVASDYAGRTTSGEELNTPQALIVYNVYESMNVPVSNFTTPVAQVSGVATSYTATNLAADATYYYVVRAADVTGNADGNVTQVSATTEAAPDVAPPTFAGIESAIASGTNSITLGWTPADDSVSDAAALIYNIYLSAASGEQDFATPTHITGAGASGFEVTGLTPDTTYYFVVRAEDEAGNEDSNTVELWASTDANPTAGGVDYTSQIAPIFANCTACHGGLMGWFFEDYASIESSAIEQPASNGVTELARFDADDSYLIWKIEGRPEITGVQMPPGGELTQEQIDLMTDWIDEGILEVPDTTAPDFEGATAANPDGPGAIRIEWNAASDVAGETTSGSPINTPAFKIVYNVYQSVGAPVSDFTTPTRVAPGFLTSITMSGLAADTTYYYVVRAVDMTGNMDANTEQVNVTTAD